MSVIKSEIAARRRGGVTPTTAAVEHSLITVQFTKPLVLGDIIELDELDPGVRLVDAQLAGAGLDTNATPALAFAIGEINPTGTDLAVVYETGIKCGGGANGTIGRLTTCGGLVPSAKLPRKLGLKVTAAPATDGTTGNRLVVVAGIACL
ncbi:hypothetical protein D3C72_1178220 [compost metagenome]